MARRGPRTRSNSCPMNPEAPMTKKRMSEDMLSQEIEFEGYLSRAHYRSTYLKYQSLAFGKSVLRSCVESPSKTGFMANAAISDLPSPNVTLKPNCSKASRMQRAGQTLLPYPPNAMSLKFKSFRGGNRNGAAQDAGSAISGLRRRGG